jgi:hypothetical protein
MERTSHQLLARARFAGEQHRCVDGRDALHAIEGLA